MLHRVVALDHCAGARYLVLWDGKGRPGGEKRRHVLPLMGKALEDLRAIDKSGDFLFSTDGGKKHIATRR